jgi:imidazolonepropionase-like amidohydrolase
MTRALHVRGAVLPDGSERDLFIRDGAFTFEPDGDATTILDGGYLIPGLVDVHSHLPFNSPAPSGASWEEAARASARLELDAGVLALRDPGAPTPVGIGPSVGLPRTFTAGRFLAAEGHMFPEHGQIDVTDDQLADAAEEQWHASGEWVKVIGDFPLPGEGFDVAFKPEALAEVVRRVHGLGGRVAIHAIAAETIEAAIEAGIDSIEHGLMLRPDQAERMASRGIALTPTLVSTPAWLPGFLKQLQVPDEEVKHTADAVERHAATVRAAWEAGVTVLAGTDAGVVAHGLVHREVGLLSQAGIPLEDALAAASWRARAFLGLPAMGEGAPADLVAFDRNPLEDPSVLASPSLIVLDGIVVKGPVAAAGRAVPRG